MYRGNLKFSQFQSKESLKKGYVKMAFLPVFIYFRKYQEESVLLSENARLFSCHSTRTLDPSSI